MACKVLILEDTITVAKLYETWLEDCCEITRAATWALGQHLYLYGDWDLVILDLHLLDGKPWPIIESPHKKGIVVVISGEDNAEVRARVESNGCIFFNKDAGLRGELQGLARAATYKPENPQLPYANE